MVGSSGGVGPLDFSGGVGSSGGVEPLRRLGPLDFSGGVGLLRATLGNNNYLTLTPHTLTPHTPSHTHTHTPRAVSRAL